MVTVPITKRTETRPLGAGGFSSNLSLPDMPNIRSTGGIELGQAVSRAADDMHQATVERANTTALLAAQKGMDDWESSNLFDSQNGAYAQRGQNAFNLPNNYMPKYEEAMNGLRSGLTEEQQLSFDKMYISRRGNIAQGLMTHERKEMDDFRRSTAEGAVASSTNRAALYANDDKMREASVTNAVDSMRSYFSEQGLAGPALDGELAKVEGKARFGVLSRLADENPHQALDFYNKNLDKFGPEILGAQRIVSSTKKSVEATALVNNAMGNYMPKTQESDIINYIIGPQIEGGDKIVADGGGVAKYGINSVANPDVDVETLTQDSAYQLAKEKYYDKFGIDKLPPQMRLVVFDRVFNGYDERVLGKPLDKLIEEADGDPQKFLKSSGEYLQKLAVQNPDKHAQNLTGWMNRLGKIRGQLDAMQGTPPNEEEVYAEIARGSDNPEIVDAARTLAKKQIDMRNSSIKAGYDSASEEAYRYQQQGQEVPPSVISRMNPKAAVEMQEKKYEPITYERVRNQVAFGQPVDLESVRWKMTPAQFDELRATQRNATEQSVMRAVDSNIKQGANLKLIIGKAEPKTDDDFAKIDSFRKVVNQDIADLRAKKINVDDDEVEKIVDRQLKRNKSGWGSDGYAIKKIPDSKQYMIRGETVDYPRMVANLSEYAQDRNIPVTDENLAHIYGVLKGKGIIKEQ